MQVCFSFLIYRKQWRPIRLRNEPFAFQRLYFVSNTNKPKLVSYYHDCVKEKKQNNGANNEPALLFFGLSADIIVIATYTTLKFIFNNMNDWSSLNMFFNDFSTVCYTQEIYEQWTVFNTYYSEKMCYERLRTYFYCWLTKWNFPSCLLLVKIEWQ